MRPDVQDQYQPALIVDLVDEPSPTTHCHLVVAVERLTEFLESARDGYGWSMSNVIA